MLKINPISDYKNTVRWIVIAMVILIMAMPSFAQSVSLNVNTDDFINAINQWMTLAVGIIVIGVGIRGAFALANYVGDMIINAFSMRR